MKMPLSKETDGSRQRFRSRSRSKSRSRSRSICLGLHVCFIQFCLLTEVTCSFGLGANQMNPESICASSDHASCSRQDWVDTACEDYMTRDNISTGDLFDKLINRSNCRGEFILGKAGFNLTVLYNDDIDTLTHCQAGFDPNWTWDYCSDSDRSCDLSVEVCDADRPGETCFTNDSTHVNGINAGYFGSNYYWILSVSLDGQLPCTRCLLQIRYYYKEFTTLFHCYPIAIKRDESASKDNPVRDHERVKTTFSGTKGVSDQETVKTTMATTQAVNDKEMVKTTIAGTTAVNEEEMVKTTRTTDGTRPVLQTTQHGGDSDDSETTPPGVTTTPPKVTTTPSPPKNGDQLDKGEKGTKWVDIGERRINWGKSGDIGEKGTNSGNYNKQVGHITTFFSTMVTLTIVLF